YRELVDRDVFASLEHVDADDVAADRADTGRDQTKRTRSVRKPDAHDETGHGSRLRRGGARKTVRNTAFTGTSRTLAEWSASESSAALSTPFTSRISRPRRRRAASSSSRGSSSSWPEIPGRSAVAYARRPKPG